MKTCSKCRAEKPETEFSARSSSKDGLHGRCKECRSAYFKKRRQDKIIHIKAISRVYHLKNKAAHNAQSKAGYQANKQRHAERRRIYKEKHGDRLKALTREKRAADPEPLRAKRRQHYRENKSRYVAQAREREKHIKIATPPWADLEAIAEFYDCRETVSAETGILHHVDHIVPLRGKNVCGLHVPWNLQVIPAVVNLEKSNGLPLSALGGAIQHRPSLQPQM